MKSSVNGTASDAVRGPATSGTRRKVRSRTDTRSQTTLRVVILCLAMTSVFAAGIFLRNETPSIPAQSGGYAPTRKVTAPTSVGTIRLARDGDSCREVKIDNNTGKLTNSGRVDCKEGAIPSEPREMTRRLEAIRDAFTGREP
jgi:hypothetical protein